MDWDFQVAVSAFDLKIQNEEETVRAMGEVVKTDLERNLAAGRGARGALPRPKDGGRPMFRTGLLAKSINVVMRQRGRRRGFIGPMRDDSAYEWSAAVYATGDRPDAKQRRANDRRNTKERRQRATEEALADLAAGRSSPFLRRVPTKSGNIFKLGRVRSRSGHTNAAVAAILSQPPKDLRAKNGDRAQYRVFEPTQQQKVAAARVAQKVMRPILTGGR